MTAEELAKVVRSAKCRVVGWEDAGSPGHRLVLAVLVQAFDNSESSVLCEPSLARKTTRPPDVVLIDPEAGLQVFEVKSVTLDQIEAVEPGGRLRIRYASGPTSKNPITQARNAMFDIKDATVRAFDGELRLRFRYWVALPLVTRPAWMARWGEDAFCPPEFLFGDDLESSHLPRRLGATDRRFPSNTPIDIFPPEELDAVWRAFGDSSVLYPRPEDRQQRRVPEGTLGEQFDEAAEAHKALSDEQQRLSSQDWSGGPRLIRGVAGSGKTVVLANNLARRVQRAVGGAESLYPQAESARVLAVCFNRTLAPFIRKKIEIAYLQRTGGPLPEKAVEVYSYNHLMWRLAQAGLWRYQPVESGDDARQAAQYLGDLQHAKQHQPKLFELLGYDAVYVDEGQDFSEEQFRLLKELCRTPAGAEPNLYVFYDDAQNLYGRRRPNWHALGLNMRGRSHVMTECHRNTRAVVESTFNVLYGSCAVSAGQVPTKDFGDITTLEQKGLIEKKDGFYAVRFARRSGRTPLLHVAQGTRAENQLVVSRLRWLVQEQDVRPEDILVLSYTRQRATELAEAVGAAGIPKVAGLHVAFNEKDRPLGQSGRLTLSTVASAKGYDAYCVLLAGANDFTTDVTGRASFYVGCTRAIEHLEVSAYEKKGLVSEYEAVLARLGGRGGCDTATNKGRTP